MVLSSKMAAALVEVARNGTHALTKHFRLFVSRGVEACPSVCYTARGLHTGGVGGACAQIRTRGAGQGRIDIRKTKRLQGRKVSTPSPVLSAHIKRRLLSNTSVTLTSTTQPRKCHPAFLDSELARHVDMRPGLNAISFSGTEKRSILGCGGLSGAGALLCPIPHPVQTSVRMKSSRNKENGRRLKHNANVKKRKQKHRTKPSFETKNLINDFGKNYNKPVAFENGLFSGRVMKNNSKINPLEQNQQDIFRENKDFVENWSTGFPQDKQTGTDDTKTEKGTWNLGRFGEVKYEHNINEVRGMIEGLIGKNMKRSEFVMKNEPQDILGPIVFYKKAHIGELESAKPSTLTHVDTRQPIAFKDERSEVTKGEKPKAPEKKTHFQKQSVQEQIETQNVDPVEDLVMKVASTYKQTEKLFKRLQPYIAPAMPGDKEQAEEPKVKKRKPNVDNLKLKPNMKKASERTDFQRNSDPEVIALKTFESRLRGPRLTVSKDEITARYSGSMTNEDQFPYGHPAFTKRNAIPTSKVVQDFTAGERSPLPQISCDRKTTSQHDFHQYSLKNITKSTSPFRTAGSKIRESIENDCMKETNRSSDCAEYNIGEAIAEDIMRRRSEQSIQNLDENKENKSKYSDDSLSEKWANKYSSQQQYAYLRALLDQRSLGLQEIPEMAESDASASKDVSKLWRADMEPRLVSESEKARSLRRKHEAWLTSKMHPVDVALERKGRSTSSTYPWVGADLTDRDRGLIEKFSDANTLTKDPSPVAAKLEALHNPDLWYSWGVDPDNWRSLEHIPSAEPRKSESLNSINADENLIEAHMYFKNKRATNDAKENEIEPSTLYERKGSKTTEKSNNVVSCADHVSKSVPEVTRISNDNCALQPDNQCLWPDCAEDNVCVLNTNKKETGKDRNAIKVTPRKKSYPRYLVDQAPFPFLSPRGCDVRAKNRTSVIDDIRFHLKGCDTKRTKRRSELEHRYTRLINRRQGELVNLLGKLRDLRARSSRK